VVKVNIGSLKGRLTKFGLAAQRRHTLLQGMFSFISLDKDVRLKPLLCAAYLLVGRVIAVPTSNHPAWQGAVCTLLNGRLRFS
jgi:hypothetical protein